MKGEQEREGKIEGATRTGGSSFQTAGAVTNNTTTISMAKKAGNATSAGDNSVHSAEGY